MNKTVAVLKSKPKVLGKWAHVPHQTWDPENSQDQVGHLHLQKPDFTKIKPIFCLPNLGPNNLRILCILFPGFSSKDSGYQSWKNRSKLRGFLEHQGACIGWIRRILLQVLVHLLQDAFNVTLITPRTFEIRAECMSWDFVDNMCLSINGWESPSSSWDRGM